MKSRTGSILLLVSGIAAMLAILSYAFFARMRRDAEESTLVLQVAQVRLMLHAGCSYIQEASRAGYDVAPMTSGPGGDPVPDFQADAVHEECWGWVDIRDGSLGPKDGAGTVWF